MDIAFGFEIGNKFGIRCLRLSGGTQHDLVGSFERLKIWENKWIIDAGWMFLPHYLTAQGSNVWKRIVEAWESMLEHIIILPPHNIYQVLNTHILSMASPITWPLSLTRRALAM